MVRHKYDPQVYKDILISAIEGGTQGIGYWVEVKKYHPDVCTAFVRDFPENGEKPICSNWRVISPRVIQRGLDRIAENKIKINDDYIAVAHLLRVKPDSADMDAPFADCVIQAGLFNEIIFG